MARELFIYWRAARADAPRAEAGAAQVQAALREEHPGLVARLYRRANSHDGTVTLMETYAHPAGVGQSLQAAIAAAAANDLAAWCLGERHLEVFDVVGP